MLLNAESIKRTFEETILPEYNSYLKKNNGHWKEQKELTGELYTKIRRYLLTLVQPSGLNLSVSDIGHIGVDIQNNLISMKFQAQYSSQANKKESITMLNNILSEIDFKFVRLQYQYEVDKIIESVNLKSI